MNHNFRTRFAVTFFIAYTATFLAGCASSDREERRWTEDVLLEDGTTVRIERYVLFEETDALGGGAYNAVETKATLRFTGELASLPAWDFPRIPLVLYRSKESNRWRIVAITSSCEAWHQEGRLRPPYWEYELADGRWQNVPLHPESIGRQANLYYYYTSGAVPSHVTASITQAQSNARTADYYRSIAADPKDFNCM